MGSLSFRCKLVATASVIFFVAVSAFGPATAQDSAPQSADFLTYNKIRSLEQMHERFAKKQIAETDMRDLLRVFYSLSPTDAEKLKRWAEASPRSYTLRLGLGLHYRFQSGKVLGGVPLKDAPEEKKIESNSLYVSALSELRAAMDLDDNPYFSIVHLMAMRMGRDKKETDWLAKEADRVFPENTLARARYALSLTPRWGGSYEALQAYIARTEAEGAPAVTVKKLKAIYENDLGSTYRELDLQAESNEHYRRALKLGRETDKTFVADFLKMSFYYVCKTTPVPPECS